MYFFFNSRPVEFKEVAVINYHRIANLKCDPWNIGVEPANFASQLAVLAKYNVVSLHDLKLAFNKKIKLKPNTLALTFDDAYQDNFNLAAPMLKKAKLPATFFCTNLTGQKKEFWWDVLTRIIFETPVLPHELCLHIPQPYTWYIKPHSNHPDALSLQDFFYQLYNVIIKYYHEKERLLDDLRTWSGNYSNDESNLTMSTTQMEQMCSDELFTAGIHTVSHPYLPYLTYEQQLNEFQQNAHFIREVTGVQPCSIAYPHGGYNQETLKAVKKMKLELGFTTRHEALSGQVNKWEVPRINAWNCNGVEFEQKLNEIFSQNI